ncbi:hypothetical protein Q8A67_020781 [Cirrhinus molitorella]|uniref:Uncharacterized protein n=1 Tax=Cirrhinus molitorella TaxID=172907 RepID=A0AA88PK42_9TELE|nr:hypothetical protein Q8A67_020781 [Cirrhinus molitorella]
MGMMNQHALKQRGGYGNRNGNGNGYRAPSYGGYTNGGATKAQQGYGGYANGGTAKQPNTGSSLQNMGYPSGGIKGPKPGYGAKAGASNGQGAKPNGSNLQNMGYPNGGIKGPKPAYGAKAGSSNGQGAMPNGYPNGGTKGPKPGYGAKAGLSNGQEAKPNGYSLQNMGYPNGGTKGPKPGYGAKAGASNGQGANPNGYGGYPNGGASRQPNTGSSFQNMGYPNGGMKGPKAGSGYPNGKGGVSSQPGFGAGIGGYPTQNMNNGYKAGYGGYGNKFKNPAGPQGGQPLGFGSKGKSQAKYGIGGLPFGGSPNGHQTKPSGQYGNDGQRYGTKPYSPQNAYGNLPYNSQPLRPESVAKSPGQKGLNYGGQPFDLRPDAMPGKYGSPESLYNPQSVSLSGDAKSSKYGNPAVSYELLGPVTDGQSVEENRSLEALHQGPEIDGQKSIDQFGDGEIPPHPDTPGAGEANAQSRYGTGDYTDGRVQPEVVSFPGVPTVVPAPHIPAVTSFDTTLDGSSLVPVSVPDVSTVSEVSASPVFPQPELPSLKQQPVSPQQIHIQQHLKFHFHPQGNSQTGKEGKYKLNGFFGNKYQG